MAATFTPNAVLGDGVSVMGPFRVAFGTATADGTTATFTVGLDTISAIAITGLSATSGYLMKATFSGANITLQSTTSGDEYHVFAIGR